MAFVIPGSSQDAAQVIITAVQRFPARYHLDFAQVRALAVQWLEQPSHDTATLLSDALMQALLNWGAGQQRAGRIQQRSVIMETLTSQKVRDVIVGLRDDDGHLIDEQVIQALDLANGGLVVGYNRKPETTFLYSTKALMLITGIGPALDSNVREGLKNLNLAGFSTAQIAASRLVPILLAADQWTRDQADAISLAAAQDETVAQILRLRSPARLMDILLFVGGQGLTWKD